MNQFLESNFRFAPLRIFFITMHFLKLHFKLVFYALLGWQGMASAAYLSRPELVDFNFAGAVICEKTPLRIKFDHENFNPGNIFTVEIAVSGNFSGSNIIQMTGSLSQSGNQQNVFLNVTFPSNVPAGSNYRLRVRGSNPVTFSQELNEHAFSVVKLFPSDPSFYPQNYWRGYFYTWTPSSSAPIPDGNNEDIFNPVRYSGYISESSESFDFTWGNNISAPATQPGSTQPDTSRVCGTYRDFYSIRMRRRFQLQAGYYVFSGGADDGFRFSINGGQTWLLNDWSDHLFREVNNSGSNSCGQYLAAGSYDFVVEYYENRIDARFKFNMTRASQSADFTGLQSSYCLNGQPATLLSSGPGVFTGPGMNGNVFSPQLAGPGTHTISHYLSGSCSDTVRKTVEVTVLPDASFSGLPPSICTDAGSVNLQAITPGGNFSGPGISGNVFSPAGLTTGSSLTISYSVGPAGCQAQSNQIITIQPIPNAAFSGLPTSVCQNAIPVLLQPITPNGIFSGSGITGNFFSPSGLKSDTSYSIAYAVSLNGCSSQSSQTVLILASADAGFTGLPNQICTNAEPVTLIAAAPGGIFQGSGISGNEFSPAGLATGIPYIITHTLNSGTACSSQSQKAIVVQPVPDASFTGLPDSLSDRSGRINLLPLVAGGVFSGQGTEGNSFNPGLVAPGLIDVSHTIVANGCTSTSIRKVYVFRFLIPNLITANDDTDNDNWLIKGLPSGAQIKIFNRWGQEVFSGEGRNSWNPGKDVEAGYYYYQILFPQESKPIKGWIEITTRKE
jgi:gliding motility-associated-like protein